MLSNQKKERDVDAVVIGIDPGLTGALSLFVSGSLRDIKDMPVRVISKAAKGADLHDLIGGTRKKEKRDIDPAGLSSLLRDWTAGHSARLIIEKVGVRPQQGISSSAKFMEGVGVIKGIAAALCIPTTLVLPETWQRAVGAPMGRKDDKARACTYAAELFPKFASWFARKSMDHGRAESALIGLYGVRYADADREMPLAALHALQPKNRTNRAVGA